MGASYEIPAGFAALAAPNTVKVQPWGGEVKAIAWAHSGMLTSGLVSLAEFAARDG
jgi:hypothetical protein